MTDCTIERWPGGQIEVQLDGHAFLLDPREAADLASQLSLAAHGAEVPE